MNKGKEPTVKHTIDDKGREALDRPVNGTGGAQDFLKKLDTKFTGTNTAELTDKEYGQLNRNAENGTGGFQDRFADIRGTPKK